MKDVMVLNVSLFRKRVLTDDQVKIRSLQWAITQYNWFHYKKGNLDTETGTYRGHNMKAQDNYQLQTRRRPMSAV